MADTGMLIINYRLSSGLIFAFSLNRFFGSCL